MNLLPQVLTEAPSIPSALVSMLLQFPNMKFVIVTLGEDGCIMLERSENGQCNQFLWIVKFICLCIVWEFSSVGPYVWLINDAYSRCFYFGRRW